ncbi:MAG: prepilin-type N-terminal cleavage/methylation domain-containing protein [archaeon]|nr:prepilin-type N-terminal cleavage/methylation domain-containing protein [archaeon]
MQKGFTLPEVLIALFVLTIGAVGVFSLTTQVTTRSTDSTSQLIASYLAQEGIEVVRNIRDSNLLDIHKGGSGLWIDGLLDPSCLNVVKLKYEYQIEAMDTSFSCDVGAFLKRDSSGYGYSTGEKTIFKRKVVIEPDSNPDIIEVDVEVSWDEDGIPRSVTVSSILYNWFSPALTPTPTP